MSSNKTPRIPPRRFSEQMGEEAQTSNPKRPYKFKSDYHRRAWWFLNNSSSQPDPDPELTWWVWTGGLIIDLIDRLNRLAGAEKPKHKNSFRTLVIPYNIRNEHGEYFDHNSEFHFDDKAKQSGEHIEHMECTHMMPDMYAERKRRKNIIAQWKQTHHWSRRLYDWMFCQTYNFVDIPDSYFEKPKHAPEEMASIEDLFDGYEDEPTRREDRQPCGTPYTR